MEFENEVQTDEQEMASVMAGYAKARGDEPPAEVVKQQDEVAQPEPEAAAEQPTVKTLADELAALKAKVAASNSDPDAVRRMHGEIGNINRTLQQLTAKPAPVPVKDEWTAAMEEAEKVAEEFPEFAAPIVKAMRAAQAKQAPAEDIDERVNSAVERIRQADAIESLREEHPDYEAVCASPEYQTWLAAKTPEFQERLKSTWNPAVAIKGLSEFKDSLKAAERKKNRLAAAVAPTSATQQGGPSVLPDEAGLLIGYQSGPKRQTFKR